MAKPTDPNIEFPQAFAIDGQKTDFLEEKIQDGFDPVDPDVLAGDNLNKFIDDTYKGLHYSIDGVNDLYKGAVLYSPTETYNTSSIVFNINEDVVKIYRSLTDNNIGNPLTDVAKWEEIFQTALSTKLNQSQITNCLLEVPQRVNVELNSNHQIILKAGSIVIVPYGTSAPTMEIGDTLNGGEIVDISWDGEKLFYYVKSNSDLIAHNSYNSYRLVLMTNDGDGLTDMPTTATFSQDTAPTVPSGASGYALWYDTASNIIKYTTNNGSSWTEYYSLPFALMSPYYESIKNIFNGFGFIGSTVWCDKGVKWLLPDGRNADGSLKNAIQETDKLNLATRTFTVTVPQIVGLSYSEKKINIVSTYYYEQVTPPQVIGTALWYNPLQNLIYYKSNGGSDWVLMDIIKIGTIMPLSSTTADSRISVFFKNNTFNALDSNNTEFIAHQAMPGSNYIDLSLPASEGNVTAPADGYFSFSARRNTSASNEAIVQLVNNTAQMYIRSISVANDRAACVFINVSKGDNVTVYYDNINTSSDLAFRFIYANGSL